MHDLNLKGGESFCCENVQGVIPLPAKVGTPFLSLQL